jgi:hypothetical protein
MAVDGDEGKVGGADVTAFPGEVALYKDLDSDFHRGAINPVHGRLEDHQVADTDRNQEIDVVR